LAQYELLGQLGKGNIGEVWKARDLSFHRDVAVKIFHTDLQRSEAHFLTRLTNEGQALVTLRHPNIVPVHEIKVSRPAQSQETTAYLVMDYIGGQVFTDYLRATIHKGLLPAFTDIIYLFTSLGAAIDYAHQQGIVHGNIKPSNILLNRHNTTQFKAGEPLLTDFGLTQLAGITGNNCNPLYLSPEQAQGFPANNRSDIYTLGVLLYELCTGIVPFRDENPVAVMTQHIHRLPTPPMLINPNIPPTLSEVILRAMAKDPFMRFPQASLLAAVVADASSLQSPFYTGKPLPLENGNVSNTSPKISSILGVAQPYPQVSTPKPLTSQPRLQPHSMSAFAPPFPSPPSGQTKPIPTASAAPAKQSTPEPAQLSDTGKQTMPSPAYTESENSSKFKSLPSLPTMRSASMAPAAPPLQGQTAQQPLINTNTAPRIIAPQMPVPVSRAIQPDQAAAVPYYTPQVKQEQSLVPVPVQALPPSLSTRARLFYNKAPGYIIFASLLIVILVLGSAIGISLLIHQEQSPSTANGPGHIFFQDDALGQNDQLRIDMQNIPDPPEGKSYFAWLQETSSHVSPLGPLNIQNGYVSFIYAGDTMHTNLLGAMQGLFITTVDKGSEPQSPNESNKVYQASFDVDTLVSLKNILYQTPGLPDNGSVTAEILNTIRSINDKTTSINDSLDYDNVLVIRQASRIIDLLDGSAYAAQSGDRPASVASELNAQIGLLSSPTQTGYLDVLDQQLQQLQQVSQNTPDRLQHIQNVENAIQDLRSWLQNLRTYDVQLLKSTNLSNPANLSIALQLKQAAADAYTGRTIPPNTAPQPVLDSAGASQAYTEAQYLATLDLIQAA
jgi:serine/threonine protein kinase